MNASHMIHDMYQRVRDISIVVHKLIIFKGYSNEFSRFTHK